MSDKKKWKRKLPPHIYDYNYKVGESYYNPQTDYIETRDLYRTNADPPKCKNYAERFADRPIYGNTRGLPYADEESALAQPLRNRRASSVGRASSRERELDDNPSAFKSGRGRDRKLSINLDDFDMDLKSLKSSFFDDDTDLKRPRSNKATTIKHKSIPSEESFDIDPVVKKGIQDDINKLKKEFIKADHVKRGAVPQSVNYERTVYNDEGIPGKKSVKRSEMAYSLPSSGTTVRKSSYTESSKFESSKPPRAPKPFRQLSIDNVDFKTPPRSTRRRNISFSDDDGFDKLSSSSRLASRSLVEDAEKQFRGSHLRRNQESEDLTANINKMIDKMRKHSIDDTDGFKFTRTIRASSLDPYEKEPRMRVRNQARSHQFSYGVSS